MNTNVLEVRDRYEEIQRKRTADYKLDRACLWFAAFLLSGGHPPTRQRKPETPEQRRIRLANERIQRNHEKTRYAPENAPNRRRLTQLAVEVKLPRNEWGISTDHPKAVSDRRFKALSPHSKLEWRENMRNQIYCRKQTMLDKAQAAGKKTYKEVTAELDELWVELTELLYLDSEALDNPDFAK